MHTACWSNVHYFLGNSSDNLPHFGRIWQAVAKSREVFDIYIYIYYKKFRFAKSLSKVRTGVLTYVVGAAVTGSLRESLSDMPPPPPKMQKPMYLACNTEKSAKIA